MQTSSQLQYAPQRNELLEKWEEYTDVPGKFIWNSLHEWAYELFLNREYRPKLLFVISIHLSFSMPYDNKDFSNIETFKLMCIRTSQYTSSKSILL